MARIIRIGKHNWVVGMSWNAYEDTPSKDDLKDDAKRLHAAWACVRIGESIQGGFCPAIGNAKTPKNLYSLAAFLADSRQQPWLGTFKIEEGLWWYIAVRDGHAILPDGDVIGGEPEILKAREQHSGFTDWNYLEGGIDVLTDFINEVASQKTKPTPVRPLFGGPAINPWAIVGAGTILAASAGGYLYWDHQVETEKKAREAAQARMRAQLAANRPPIAPTPSPLLTTPTANDWLQACASVLYPLPLSKFGWALDQVSCGENAATVAWLRMDGATIDYKPEGVVDADGQRIEQSLPLPEISRKNADDALPLPDAKAALRAWAQAANYDLKIIDAAPLPPPLPGSSPLSEDGTQGMPPPTPQVAFVLGMRVTPVKEDFSMLRGFRLTGAKVTETGWHLDGVLYGR